MFVFNNQINPLHPKSALTDFTPSNARQFYSSKGEPLWAQKTISLDLLHPKSALTDFTLSNARRFTHLGLALKGLSSFIFENNNLILVTD